MAFKEIKGKPVRMQLPDGMTERRDPVRREALVRRIVAEFDDMPGLALTLQQASRLMGVEEAVCARILTTLTRNGLLRRNSLNLYVRAERPSLRAS